MLELWLEGILNAFSFYNLLIMLGGSALGLVFGALPGLGPTLAVSLMIPITFGLSPQASLILLSSVYVSSIFGGSIPAILLNAPGTPGSAATGFDGYPMAQQGKGGVALGISATASLVGGLISVIFLMALAPVIAQFSLRFGPAELFMLALFGLTIIAVVAKASIRRGLVAGGLGLLLSFVGQDLMTGQMRFDFGLIELQDGIPFILGLVGMLAASEAFSLAEKKGSIARAGKIEGNIFTGVALCLKYRLTLIKSSLIGTFVGALPGAGISAANFIAYSEAIRTSKDPDSFGKGNPEGVVASEAANNAVTGGSLIPTLTLSLPGNPSAAAFLAGLMIHGLRPGADLFSVNVNITAAMFAGLILANFVFFGFALVGANFMAKITLIKNEMLVPSILVLSLVGGFALRNRFSDVILIIFFAFLGYFLKKYKFPVVAVVLGLILGPIAERGYHQALMISGGTHSIFFTRPISLFLFLMIVFSIGSQFVKPYIDKYKAKKKQSE